MSVQATTWVWDHSEASGSDLLVLLAIADAANKQGGHSCQSASTIASMARVSERTVFRSLRSLTSSGQIAREGESDLYGTAIYCLPKMAERTPDKLSPPDNHGVRPLTNTTPTYDMDGRQPQNTYPSINPKECPTPDGVDVPPAPEDPDQAFIVESLCKHLAGWVARNTGMKEKPVGKRWLDACRRMIDIDGLDPREMWHVLDWSQKDEFWQGNIQSMDTFRKQYGKLVVGMRGHGRGPRNKIREALDSVQQEMASQQQEQAALSALDWELPIGEIE